MNEQQQQLRNVSRFPSPFLNSSKSFDLQKLAEFLANPLDISSTIRIWHPKVVQRSYGKEKRYFSPPLLISLSGPGWELTAHKLQFNLEEYRMQIQHNINALASQSFFDEAGQNRYLLNQLPNMPIRRNVDIGINDGTVQFIGTLVDDVLVKNLSINSVDKRRYFKLHCEIRDYLGPSTLFPVRYLGDFESSEIRVVSKPPKKQTIRLSDSAYICLKSGMQIALYNRARPQAPTHYLYAEDNNFTASQDHWSSFYIYVVNTDEYHNNDKSFAYHQGFIHYGHVVRLVDALTGISTPNLILRKIEKEYIQISPQSTNEPVAQLQRVALQFCDSANSYWGIFGNTILQKRAAIINPDRHEIHETVSWTLATSEMIEYKFYEIMGPTLNLVTPIPIVKTAQLEGVTENNAVIDFSGFNFGLQLFVYFGLCSAHIISVNAECIRCKVPPLAEMYRFMEMGFTYQPMSNNNLLVPITFVREDGVAYPIGLEFEYNCYAAGEIGKIVLKKEKRNVEDDEDDSGVKDDVFTD